jgi:hypothetical protein
MNNAVFASDGYGDGDKDDDPRNDNAFNVCEKKHPGQGDPPKYDKKHRD